MLWLSNCKHYFCHIQFHVIDALLNMHIKKTLFIALNLICSSVMA